MSQEFTTAIILSPVLVPAGDPAGRALENFNTNVLANGSLCYVETGIGQGEWQLQKEATDAPDGTTIVQPISGPGRWFLKILPGVNGGGGGSITSVSGINGITTVNPGGPAVQVNGAALLPLDGSRSMTGNLNMGTNALTNVSTGAFSGAVTGLTFNGVALTTAGSATNFLNEQGNYVAVSGGGGTISMTVSAIAATVGADPGANSMRTYLLTFAGARTFSLPATAADGARITVKEAANNDAAITVSVAGGADIDFAASNIIATAGGSATYQYEASTNQWWVI